VPLESLILCLPDAATLRDLYERQLSKGFAFVPDGSGVREFEACELVLDHEGRTLRLRAEAVFIKTEGLGRGIGLQLSSLDATAKADLLAFVDGAVSPETRDRAEDPAAEESAELTDESDRSSMHHGDERAAKTLSERIRGLSSVQQQRLAAKGTMAERIALERAFGSHVWEALLANSRLTIPEVAWIARKGTLPRPLVEDIAGHASWVAAPQVQRALLANPRSSAAVVTQVLRALSRSDLQLVPLQTAYPQTVRAAAKRMLGM
jgi:hypothetical protein